MNVLANHVRMVEHVQIMSTNTLVSVHQDIKEQTVKQVRNNLLANSKWLLYQCSRKHSI